MIPFEWSTVDDYAFEQGRVFQSHGDDEEMDRRGIGFVHLKEQRGLRCKATLERVGIAIFEPNE